jgi:hypothetical protein
VQRQPRRRPLARCGRGRKRPDFDSGRAPPRGAGRRARIKNAATGQRPGRRRPPEHEPIARRDRHGSLEPEDRGALATGEPLHVAASPADDAGDLRRAQVQSYRGPTGQGGVAGKAGLVQPEGRPERDEQPVGRDDGGVRGQDAAAPDRRAVDPD